jgi:hypothetical protein
VKILIASFHTMPGISGGWTTPLDLLGPDHEVTYVVSRGRPGRYRLEGVEVNCAQLKLPMVTRPGRLAGYASRWNLLAFRHVLRQIAASRRFDCLVCLETVSAICAQKVGLRYVLRLHDYPDAAQYERAKKNAVLVTSVDPSVPGARYLPHAIDVSRYHYNDFAVARSAVLVAALDPATAPLTFVRAVAQSNVPGTIYGDGSMRPAVARACRETTGKVTYAGPVQRLALDSIYQRHEIGIACINRARNPYIMKISDYQACGLYPVVQQGTHLSLDRPDLCRVFRTEDELTEQINWVHEHWSALGPIRLANRAYVEKHYDVAEPRRLFYGWLSELKGQGRLSPC